jgi:type IV secretion system protein VirB11
MLVQPQELEVNKEINRKFKLTVKERLNQGVLPNYETIKNEVFHEYGIPFDYKIDTISNWYKKIFNLSYIIDFVSIQDINEIIIHNHQTIQVDYGSYVKVIDIQLCSQEDLQLSFEVLALKNGKDWNYKTPFASFSIKILQNEFRSTLIHYSTGPQNSSRLFLRKMRRNIISLDSFNVPSHQTETLKNLISQKKNIIIAGPTGSGKTTLLQTFLDQVNSQEHVIILEDTDEIYSPHPNFTKLIAEEKIPNKTLKRYCSYSLRMRPDRIILGEIRSNEIISFLLAMNTGHKGLMSTIHANGPQDTISRMAMLFSLYSETKEISYKQIIKLICKNIDVIIYMENREIVSAVTILGEEDGVPYFDDL